MKTEVQNLFVVGCGTMGAGIAQVVAAAGCRVSLYDAASGAAEKAITRIAASLERAQEKGFVTAADRERTLSGLRPASSFDAAAGADAVIEAVKEDLEIKKTVFRKLEEITRPDAALWTNTSMIAITRIADGLRHPERVAGTHFFNPVPRMQLVEIIGGRATAPETLELATRTVRSWGKTPVRAPDSPGFIVNRVLDALLREALLLHEEGVSVKDIDDAVRLGLNFPMGPMELMDLVGLDTTLDCLTSQACGMERPLQCGTRLAQFVAERRLGRKSGSGFYPYP